MHRFRFTRWLSLQKFAIALSCLLLLSIPCAAAFSQSANVAAPQVLLRIELVDEAQSQELSALGWLYYGQFFADDGSAYILAPANVDQQQELARRGFAYMVLDQDATSARYILLYGSESELAAAQEISQIVFREGKHALARLGLSETTQDNRSIAEKDAALIAATGLQSMPLNLQPIPSFSTAPAPILTTSLAANTIVQRMLGQVNTSELYQTVGDLSGEWSTLIGGSPYTLATRSSDEYTPITKATRYAYEQFSQLGLTAGYHYYQLYGLERRNVLAQQLGKTQPERIFLLTAHLDSTSQSPSISAPGADDNASGSAGLLHIAEILSQYQFGCTIRYALFTGEEQGLVGSWAYAAKVAGDGDQIVAVLNLDMLGYSSKTYTGPIELHTRVSNANDLAIATLFSNVVTTYGIDLTPEILKDGLSFSDHYPFWQYGYPGVLAIEDWEKHTPYYHTTQDRLYTLNMHYYTEYVRASLGTLAHMGCLLQGQLSGVVRAYGTNTPIVGALIEAQGTSGSPWTTTTLADGSFHLALPAGNYQVKAVASAYTSEIIPVVVIANSQTTTVEFGLDLLSDRIYLPMIVTIGP